MLLLWVMVLKSMSMSSAALRTLVRPSVDASGYPASAPCPTIVRRCLPDRRHSIADIATGCLAGPKVAEPRPKQYRRYRCPGWPSHRPRQETISFAVAIDDDSVLGIVLDVIVARAALDRSPV